MYNLKSPELDQAQKKKFMNQKYTAEKTYLGQRAENKLCQKMGAFTYGREIDFWFKSMFLERQVEHS